ncbi:MAG: hypothetical protein E7291_07285 [Lachnospiraceae bacterium]|nr:hypothetical protein [Lachnospiraceae bacterium]
MWKFLRKKFLKFNNKGLSMVELICGIAILGVVNVSIAGVLVVSANSYERGSSEAEVQQEAQLVANQISDLLIDATADVDFSGNVLTVKQGIQGYLLTYDPTAKTLSYKEVTYDATGAVLSSSEEQLMVEGLEKFSVSGLGEFSETGYARIEMEFSRNEQRYPADFTITARNKNASGNTTIVADIILPAEIILEPCESYDYNPVVQGLSNTNVNWSIEDNTDSSTTISSSGELTIGKDETANAIRVNVSSQEKDASNNPVVSKTVNAYIRRANTVDVSAVLVSGVDMEAGAEYRLYADINGNNFTQALGTDFDMNYVNPLSATWSVTGEGCTLAVDPTNSTIATLTLAENMAEGATITVNVKAGHPDGINKTGSDYGDAADSWSLIKPGSSPYLNRADGWQRQTNTKQADVDVSAVNSLKATVGGTQFKFQFSYRQYPDGTFTDWFDNIYGGDGDNSAVINMRPLFTGTFDYKKDYEVRIRMIITDNANNILYPIEGVTPESEYILTSVMKKVEVTFDSASNMLNCTGANKVERGSAPTIVMNRDTQYELLKLNQLVGIADYGNSATNALNFYLQKKNASGGWDDVTSGFEIQNQNGTLKFTVRNSNYEGSYRIKVQINGQPHYIIDPVNKTLTSNGTQDYILWNETTGDGIFYFNIDDPNN